MGTTIEDQSDPVLYILMRTDLESMNPGKAMAQACHAANQMVKHCHNKDLLYAWESQANAFGTTIVLDGGSMKEIQMIINTIAKTGVKDCGIVDDPTYPILDGKVVHTLPIATCGFAFIDKNDKKMELSKNLLDKKSLHS